jgi:hypothetical protein
MSTICKLNRNVRLDRYLRKMQLREMRDDLRTVDGLIAKGHKIAENFDPDQQHTPAAIAAKATHRRLMGDLILKRTILEMTLNHLAKVFKDPRRTGERKEAIFVKLSALLFSNPARSAPAPTITSRRAGTARGML